MAVKMETRRECNSVDRRKTVQWKIKTVASSTRTKTAASKPIEGLRERTEHLDIFLFLPITQWCSISDVLFTGGMGISDV